MQEQSCEFQPAEHLQMPSGTPWSIIIYTQNRRLQGNSSLGEVHDIVALGYWKAASDHLHECVLQQPHRDHASKTTTNVCNDISRALMKYIEILSC